MENWESRAPSKGPLEEVSTKQANRWRAVGAGAALGHTMLWWAWQAVQLAVSQDVNRIYYFPQKGDSPMNPRPC